MTFNGFMKEDFETFQIDGLEARMDAIRTRLQPKFKAISEEIIAELSIHAGAEMFLHIARHARRKVNAPVDTWMALSGNKRGYKQHPHFQIGLFDDRVFIWFALIYELPHKVAIANHYLQHLAKVRKLIPKDYVLSFDHMRKDTVAASHLDKDGLKQALERFRDVKKAELLVGRNLMPDDPILTDGLQFVQMAKETFETLIPLYKMALIQK
jgi:uncharacterized protein YktB (UPF0637 family)